VSVLVQREAAAIHEEWLGQALSTRPADRPAAEAAITGLYDLIGLAPPRFHWVSSPAVAVATLPPGVRPRPSEAVERLPDWPLPPRFRAAVNALCREIDSRLTPAQRSVDQVIRQRVRLSLTRSAANVLLMQLTAAHGAPAQLGSSWYGTQCVSWVAHYDALRRIGGVELPPGPAGRLGLWAAAARSCGWWWPREGVCVVSERPTAVHTEPWGDAGEVRPHHADGPAVRYADGWEVYAWHGTPVPPWVINDPGAGRISREPDAEVRRCAIERVGWGHFVDRAALRLVADAPDPGNPGARLRLYDLRADTRVLFVVNGSVERDGTRRRHGLTVPGFLTDPVEAAAWTYGLTAEQYSLLARRT
jgi:hypothetical protein